MQKRIMAMILVLAMLICVLPTGVVATEASGGDPAGGEEGGATAAPFTLSVIADQTYEKGSAVTAQVLLAADAAYTGVSVTFDVVAGTGLSNATFTAANGVDPLNMTLTAAEALVIGTITAKATKETATSLSLSNVVLSVNGVEQDAENVAVMSAEFTVGHVHPAINNGRQWMAWTDSTTVPTDSTYNYYLTTDVTMAAAVEELETDAYNIVLCLNGHNITAPATGRVYRLSGGAQVHVCDCSNEPGVITPGNITGGAFLVINESYHYGGSGSNGAKPLDTNSYLTLTNVIIDGTGIENTAGYGGAALRLDTQYAHATIDDCIIRNCSTAKFGAIRVANGTLNVTSTQFINNSCSENGGALFNSEGTVTLTGCTFRDNSALRGGAIYAWVKDATKGTTTISNSVFTENKAYYKANNEGAGNGGAIYIGFHTLDITGCTFTENSNDADGSSALYADNKSTVTVADSTFVHNRSVNGDQAGAVFIAGTTTQATFSGKIIIDDNFTATNEERNVYFNGADTAKNAFYVNGLTEGSRITIYDEKVDRSTDADTLVKVNGAQNGWDPSWIRYVNNDKYIDYADGSFSYIETSGTHPHKDGYAGVAASQEWTAWGSGTGESTSLPTVSGHYYLTQDITASADIQTNVDIKLCLNGHTIKQKTGRIFRLTGGAKVTICDCTAYTNALGVYHAGKMIPGTTKGGVAGLFPNQKKNEETDSVFTLYDGIIDGTGVDNKQHGGAIQVSNDNSSGTDTPQTPAVGVVNINGGEIRNCTAANGGAIVLYNKGVLNMTAGTIANNRANGIVTGNEVDTDGQGGAIYSGATCTLNITGGTFKNNLAHDTTESTGNGGAIYVGGSTAKALIRNVTFTGNRAYAHGGAICMRADATIENCIFTENASINNGGGALAIYSWKATVNCSTMTGNTCRSSGGAIYMNNGTLDMTGGKIEGCDAKNNGGAIYLCEKSTVTLESVEITGNTLTRENGSLEAGSAIMMIDDSKLTINEGTKIHNNGKAKSAIRASAGPNATVNKDGNQVTIAGGTIEGQNCAEDAVCLTFGQLTMSGGTIDGEGCDDSAVRVQGTMTMTGGTISGEGCGKGAVQMQMGTMTMTGGTITKSTGSSAALIIGMDCASMEKANEIRTKFTMSGGTITGNYTRGVHVEDSGDMVMQGGEISYNIWTKNGIDGAGVRVENHANFKMIDGSINHNQCTGLVASGGGINIRGTAQLLGGEISYNWAHNAGGVLVRLHRTIMRGVHVHHNTAQNNGGGINVLYGNLDIFEGTVVEYNEAIQGAGMVVSKDAGTVNMYGGMFANNIVADGPVFDGGVATTHTNNAVGSAIQSVGGVLNLRGGTITGDNNKTIYGTALYVARNGYVTLDAGEYEYVDENGVTQKITTTGTLIQNVTDTQYYVNDIKPYTIYMAGGAIPLKVTPGYQTAFAEKQADAAAEDKKVEAILTGMVGYGRVAQGTDLVDGNPLTYTDYNKYVYSTDETNGSVTGCLRLPGDPVHVLQTDASYLYILPANDDTHVFSLTYIGTDNQKHVEYANQFEDIYAAYKNAQCKDGATPYIEMYHHYQGIPVELDQDLYIHLNNKGLHSLLWAKEYDGDTKVKIYGADVATNDYDDFGGTGTMRVKLVRETEEVTTDGVTTENITAEHTGDLLVSAAWMFDGRRYLSNIDALRTNTITTDEPTDNVFYKCENPGFKTEIDDGIVRFAEGDFYIYSFHRFYAGITHSSLHGPNRGFGYKALFLGDEPVKQLLSSGGITGYEDGVGMNSETVAFGCDLWLMGKKINDDGSISEDEYVRITADFTCGASGKRLATGQTYANTYVWRLNEILLDANDEADLETAQTRYKTMFKQDASSAEAALEACNNYFKDTILCAKPFVNAGAKMMNMTGSNSVQVEVNAEEKVQTAEYQFTMKQLLELVDANVSSYQQSTTDWEGFVEFCDTFKAYFVDASGTSWNISKILATKTQS